MSSWQIYEFNGVPLPIYEQQQDLGTGAVAPSVVIVAGGAFDWSGSRRRLPLHARPTISGQYAAEVNADTIVDHTGDPIVDQTADPIVTHRARADLRAQVETLKAQVGVVGELRRRRLSDPATYQWRTARLLEVREQGEASERGVRATLDCLFESSFTGWRSAVQSSTSVLSNALVEVAGTLPVRNATLTITASATIRLVTVTIPGTGVSWQWSGTLTAGQSLVVNALARTVRRAEVNAYSGFSLAANHTADGWLDLAPGANLLYVAANGASIKTITWWDVWG